MTDKGQITLPVEMRRALSLEPGKKLNIALQGEQISISKLVDIAEARKELQEQMARQGTEKQTAEGGDGWTANVKERYGS
ncbi:MAG: AbrB/MazE/SpoVT family DNA-binding domain-containing protein [Treponema sp.]|jgi:bifunctional DNA-binding transcriptional regulator/antitoxin component of YhaV-PrlF toxin-antitoxin module|nr:AbrB/MazE/SpoVT family DNA-binding domain-containing protein [Treponema sp.]